MAFKRSKKITGGILALALLASTFTTGFTYQNGIDGVYYDKQWEVFNNTYYHEQLGGHNTNGLERAFFVTSDLSNSGLRPYVFEGEVTGRYNIDTMAKLIQEQGYTVVAGINGDLYDMKSGGSPKGLSIHDGLIKSSGYAPEYGISFDENGKASLISAKMWYTIKGTKNVPTASTTTDAATGLPKEDTAYVPSPFSGTIGYVNVPHGAGKALHMYNRQYASSTKVTEKSVEVVIDTASAVDAQPRVGGTITGTVVGGKASTTNTPIGDNQIVLSAAMDSSWAAELAQLAPGTTVEITATNNGSPALNNSKECIGVYNLLYDNGQYVTGGTGLNPRTSIGIKPDGTVVMYVVDGRQSGWSAGLGITDVAEHMVALGCTTVVNMDGGGSTMMNARVAGKESAAALKNSPSEKVQRKVSNGLFFVYAGKGNGTAAHLHPYSDSPLLLPGANVQLNAYASDNLYEKAALPGAVSYSVADGKGTVNGSGLFTAGSSLGVAQINAESSGITGSTTVEIVDDITFKTNTESISIDPGKSYDINTSCYQGYVPVMGNDSLFSWVCDKGIGTIDANGVFTAASAAGVSGSITVSYKGKSKVIPVNVGGSGFTDTQSHWAKAYIQSLAARGVVNGMGNNQFLPDSPLTRAQFLTMLAKIVEGTDVTKSPAAGFADVPSNQWYYNYVNWGFANGIVKGMDDKNFAPNAQISREQMAVMLVNYAKSTSLAIPDKGAGASFTDAAKINSWSQEAVNTVVKAGIITGYPKGNFDPQGQATRAQAATVIYKLCEVKDTAAK